MNIRTNSIGVIAQRVMAELRKSGCQLLKLGLESGSQLVLDGLHKGIDLALVEQVLAALHQAGIATYVDGTGSKRRENLAAARAAIQTMNEMLGVTDGDKKERKTYNVTLSVKDASEDGA